MTFEEQIAALAKVDPNNPVVKKFIQEKLQLQGLLGNTLPQDNKFINTVNRRPMAPFDTGTDSGAAGGMGGFGSGTR